MSPCLYPATITIIPRAPPAKMTVILVVVGALGTVPKKLGRKTGGI